ncbi:Mu transposase C-terminal domain-containing protein, partial [Streptomyces sp. NPDC054975]
MLSDQRERERTRWDRGNRDYVAAWMTGLAGERVRVRFMPHHDRRIEVFDAVTGRYLGLAELADRASPEQISAVRSARAARDRRLRKDLAAVQGERYGARARPGRLERIPAGAVRDDEDQDHDVSLGTLLMVVCLGEFAAAISV